MAWLVALIRANQLTLQICLALKLKLNIFCHLPKLTTILLPIKQLLIEQKIRKKAIAARLKLLAMPLLNALKIFQITKNGVFMKMPWKNLKTKTRFKQVSSMTRAICQKLPNNI